MGYCQVDPAGRRPLQQELPLRLGLFERQTFRLGLQEDHHIPHLWKDALRGDTAGALVIPRLYRPREGAQSQRRHGAAKDHLRRLPELQAHVQIRVWLLLPPTHHEQL